MRRIFVSDLHLDAARPAGIERFERFCREVAATADELWVLGDLFEVWIGDDADDAAAYSVRRALRHLTRLGTRCRLMHGNRDFLMGTRLARDCGAELVTDPTILRLENGPAVLTHGDRLCTDDRDYQALREHLRSDTFRREMLAKPLTERRAIGEAARQRSREANANRAEHIMDVNAGAVDALLDEHGAELLLHGHTHRPGAHVWEKDGRSRCRLVLGAWEDDCVYARADAGTPELVTWS
ncbi:MAG: UDP-2,3-diacylglucosamine diphosphatase [Pseudomonadales bacterium]|nr:UDP-2,3-diacylglucosamine diphosphatase [Pseudomonadales bacterium]